MAFGADKEFVFGVQDGLVNAFEDFVIKGAAKAGDKDADGVCFPFFKVAGEGVGVVVEFAGGGQDPAAGIFADIADFVQDI